MKKKIRLVCKKEYEQSTCKIKECQEYLIDLLKSFQSFCDDYKIDCFLMFGTLLGSKREGKIIPWDDDLDMGILDNDFNRLRDNLIHLEKYGLSYYHYSNAKNCISNEIRIYRPGFYKLQEGSFKKNLWPVCIDIFLLNKVSDSVSEQDIKKCELKLNKQYFWLDKKEQRWKSKSKLKAFALSCLRPFICSSCLHKKIDRIVAKMNRGGDYKYFIPDSVHDDGFIKFDPSYFQPLETTKFEDIVVKIPSKSEEILELLYGDWKTPYDRSEGKVFQKVFIDLRK